MEVSKRSEYIKTVTVMKAFYWEGHFTDGHAVCRKAPNVTALVDEIRKQDCIKPPNLMIGSGITVIDGSMFQFGVIIDTQNDGINWVVLRTIFASVFVRFSIVKVGGKRIERGIRDPVMPEVDWDALLEKEL